MNSTVTRRLLSWFVRERRELPWRKEPRDPYRVWVSEVMLQQTRVDVVVPYYERFLARFPTLEALAAAELDVALVDGNVARVLARLFKLSGDARPQAWKIAGELLPRGRSGQFNEALME